MGGRVGLAAGYVAPPLAALQCRPCGASLLICTWQERETRAFLYSREQDLCSAGKLNKDVLRGVHHRPQSSCISHDTTVANCAEYRLEECRCLKRGRAAGPTARAARDQASAGLSRRPYSSVIPRSWACREGRSCRNAHVERRHYNLSGPMLCHLLIIYCIQRPAQVLISSQMRRHAAARMLGILAVIVHDDLPSTCHHAATPLAPGCRHPHLRHQEEASRDGARQTTPPASTQACFAVHWARVPAPPNDDRGASNTACQLACRSCRGPYMV